MNQIQNIYEDYCNGHYDKAIKAILQIHRNEQSTSFQLDSLLIQSYIRGNYTDKAVYHGLKLYQLLHNIDSNNQFFSNYYDFLKQQNVVQAGLTILHELKELKEIKPDFSRIYKGINEKIYSECIGKRIIVYPIVWSIAFGDMIVVHQFIKQKKLENPSVPVILIMPLNRPELKELASLNTAIDYVIDITLLEAEKDRLHSLQLRNKEFHNISVQEYIIDCILQDLINNRFEITIEKTRYFPLLDDYRYTAGWRIWEKRAELYLSEKKELPKLTEQKYTKKKKITIHLREANYGEDARNVTPEQGQLFVNLLKGHFPDYEIVRLGDKSMTPLLNCRNACHENFSLNDQLREVQESALFIGSHSAPQHFAVAISNTPIICMNYGLQETCKSWNDHIPKMSLEPVGAQVKAVLYSKMFDIHENELIPRLNQKAHSVVPTLLEDVIALIHQIIT